MINEKEVAYRFDGISGPKYLLRGPHVDIGMVVIMPGEDFTCHYHERIEEDFFTLEGSVEIYVDKRKIVLNKGDLIHVPPKSKHYLKNVGDTPWKAMFVKAPYDPKDKIDVDWVPA
jgi:mannose-6-phosphate isomerase-like protein (cupin superfamily)